MLPVFSQSSTPPPASAATQAHETEVEKVSVQAPAPPPEEELAAFDVYAVHARRQDCAEHPGFQVKRYRRTAPSSSQASSGDSFLLIESSSQHGPPMSASAKCMPPLPHPTLQVPRLGKPKHQVADLAIPGSAKPQFSVTSLALLSPHQFLASVPHSGLRHHNLAAHRCLQQSPGPKAFRTSPQVALHSRAAKQSSLLQHLAWHLHSLAPHLSSRRPHS